MWWLVFAVALSVRLLHVWLLTDSPFASVLMGDARVYDEWAVQLAGGDWLGSEVFYQAPLYPYFLGVIYAVAGHDLTIVRIIQAVLGAASAVLLASATARVFSPRVGLVAGMMLALYAPAIFLSAVIQKAALDVFLVCVVIWVVARIETHSESRRPWFVLGTSLAALALTRENALILIPVALLFAGKRHGLAVVAGAALLLAPVAVRNQLVSGGFYLTTSQSGPNFYIGNNPRADGTYQALREGRGDPAFERQDAIDLAEAASGRALTPSEVSAYWRNQAVDYITSQPLDWLQLMGRKALLLASATEVPDTEAQESHADRSLVLRFLQPVGHFGVVLPLAVLGLLFTWPERHRLAMLYAFAGVYALSVLAFFVLARYRYPLVPFVLMFAAAGLSGVSAFLAQASPRRKAATAAAIAMLLTVSYWPVLSADVMRAITETNLGVALQAQGRLEEAIQQYQRAAAIRPDYAPAYNNLGVALRQRGRLREAIAAYRQSLTHFPDDPAAHLNLASALAQDRQWDEAVAHYRAALSRDPNSDAALRGLGDVLLRQGRTPEGVAQYRRRVELTPRDAGAHYELGNALLESGDVQAAELAFRRVIALAPDSAQAHMRLGVALGAQQRFKEAVIELRTALTLRPDYPEARRFLMMAEERLQQR